jgi:hypothetical protein
MGAIICGENNDAFCAGQNLLRVGPFLDSAFEPGHFAMLIAGQPVLESFRAGGRGGGAAIFGHDEAQVMSLKCRRFLIIKVPRCASGENWFKPDGGLFLSLSLVFLWRWPKK